VGGNFGFADAMDEFNVVQEAIQLRRDVFPVQCSTMVRRIRILSRQQTRPDLARLTPWDSRTLHSFLAAQFCFQHHAYSTGAKNHPGTTLVEWTCGILDCLLCGSGT
jgi:hypothetical protein